MPSIIFELSIFNLESYVEEWLNVPVVDHVKENGDGSKDPENHSDSDERVGPEGKAIVTFSRREQNVMDCDFR